MERVHEWPPIDVTTAPNPGPKTLSGTHSYIVGRDPAYVVDPGPVLPAHQERIADHLRRTNAALGGILLTHGHPDHAPGAELLSELTGAPVWAPKQMPTVDGVRVDSRYAGEQVFPLEGDELRVFPSPGHTADHVALWMPNWRVLLAGDTILGEGTTVVAPPEGDMTDYMATLDMFTALDPVLILPGHGPLVRDPRAKLREYIEHRLQREREVLEALAEGPATIDMLVDRNYAGIAPALQGLAALSVQAQLVKLQREGHVTREGQSYVLIDRVH